MRVKMPQFHKYFIERTPSCLLHHLILGSARASSRCEVDEDIMCLLGIRLDPLFFSSYSTPGCFFLLISRSFAHGKQCILITDSYNIRPELMA